MEGMKGVEIDNGSRGRSRDTRGVVEGDREQATSEFCVCVDSA